MSPPKNKKSIRERQDFWKSFEKDIELQLNARPQTYCVRIPNEVRGLHGRGHAVQVRTPFDFAASINGRAIFFDAKTCGEATFNIKSLITRDKKKHQLEALTDAANNGAAAGYLIWFYKFETIIWISIDDINNALAKGIKSFTPAHPKKQPDEMQLHLGKLIGET